MRTHSLEISVICLNVQNVNCTKHTAKPCMALYYGHETSMVSMRVVLHGARLLDESLIYLIERTATY